LVGPDAFDAGAFLHPALAGRVNGKKRGSVNLGDLALAPLQIVTGGKLSKFLDFLQSGDPNAILTKGTTYARVENDLIDLANEQKELIENLIQLQLYFDRLKYFQKVQKSTANIPRDGHATEALIPEGDKLKGSKPGADPLSGIVGPTQAVHKRYKLELNGIASGKFTQFFEENGCERLHLFDLDRAQEHFTMHGGGEIEENVYVLHPKDGSVLVPIATYHENLLAELDQEFVVALGKLGAKSLTIETVAGMTCSLGADTKISKKMKKKKPASGSARYEKGEKKETKVRWGSPTYDPDHAMDGCCLVQDKIGRKTLLQLRKTSDVVTYEKNYSIDTTFGVGVEVVQLIDASFKWEGKTQYKLVGEFFSKKEIESESKEKEDEVQSATRAGSESV